MTMLRKNCWRFRVVCVMWGFSETLAALLLLWGAVLGIYRLFLQNGIKQYRLASTGLRVKSNFAAAACSLDLDWIKTTMSMSRNGNTIAPTHSQHKPMV